MARTEPRLEMLAEFGSFRNDSCEYVCYFCVCYVNV